MIDTRPTGITLDKTQGTLDIAWNTGETFSYPLSHLREACPCVECRGGHAFMGMEFAPDNILRLTPRRSYAIQEVRPIGNYAICPVWDDGHSTGIYSWDYLYHIAPRTPDTNTD
jgi:DUF971 family protein